MVNTSNRISIQNCSVSQSAILYFSRLGFSTSTAAEYRYQFATLLINAPITWAPAPMRNRVTTSTNLRSATKRWASALLTRNRAGPPTPKATNHVRRTRLYSRYVANEAAPSSLSSISRSGRVFLRATKWHLERSATFEISPTSVRFQQVATQSRRRSARNCVYGFLISARIYAATSGSSSGL